MVILKLSILILLLILFAIVGFYYGVIIGLRDWHKNL